MLKVTDDKVTEAYKNFLRELEVLGLKPQTQFNLDLVMLGFKKGFVEGYNGNIDVAPLQVFDLTSEVESATYVSSFEEQLQMNLYPKKFYSNGKTERDSHRKTSDCYELCVFLKNQETPKTNNQIIRYMHSIKAHHWNSNNCTSFIQYAIKENYPIVKVGRGLWKYKK